jgi:hypothetical protein
MEWWTSQQIHQWETLRRGVEARFDSSGSFTLRAPQPLGQATLLVLKSHPARRSIAVNGQPAQSTPWTLHGFEFDAVTTDVSGEIKVQMA